MLPRKNFLRATFHNIFNLCLGNKMGREDSLPENVIPVNKKTKPTQWDNSQLE